MDKDYSHQNKYNMQPFYFIIMSLINNKIINDLKSILKVKVHVVLIKMELNKVDSLFSIMVKFINLGNGIRDKILSKKHLDQRLKI